MKRIFFFFANSADMPASYPLGIGQLSAILTREGHAVDALYVRIASDGSVDMAEIERRIRAFKPDLIGYSAWSPAFEGIRKIARHLRRSFNIPSVCGGAHPTLYPDHALQSEGIDYICVGDGEKTMVDIVEALEKGTSIRDIPGIYYLDEKGEMVSNRLHTLEQDLDRFPPIDYEAFGLDFMRELTSDGWARYISSRGCPYACSYCHSKMMWNIFKEGIGTTASGVGFLRFRSIDACIADILEIVKKYDATVINFMDDLFCLKRDRTLEFCRKFGKSVPKHVGYSIQTHLSHLDEETVDALHASRCLRPVVGLESANKRILDILKRQWTYKKMEKNLSLLTKAKFPLGVWTLNILGNPTETQEEMLETIAMNARNVVDVCRFGFMAPYHGSEIFEFAKKKDLLVIESKVQGFDARNAPQLKFPPRETAFLEKFFDIGHWYFNLFTPFGTQDLFRPLIEKAERIGPGAWEGSAKAGLIKEDAKLTRSLAKKGVPHYNFILQGKVTQRSIGLVEPARTKARTDASVRRPRELVPTPLC